MNKKIIIVLLVFICISIAEEGSYFHQGIIDSIVLFGNSFGDTKKEFEAKINERCHYLSKPIKNNYNNSIDTIHSTTIDNITFEFYYVTKKQKEFLRSLVVTKKTSRFKLPIWPGMKKSQVEKLVGAGVVDESLKKVVYSKSGAEWNGDLFWVEYDEDNVVRKIYWNFET